MPHFGALAHGVTFEHLLQWHHTIRWPQKWRKCLVPTFWSSSNIKPAKVMNAPASEVLAALSVLLAFLQCCVLPTMAPEVACFELFVSILQRLSVADGELPEDYASRLEANQKRKKRKKR